MQVLVQVTYPFVSKSYDTLLLFFPLQKIVYDNSGLFFLPLCTRLINDDSVNCRKLTAVAIKTLIEKVSFVKIVLVGTRCS